MTPKNISGQLANRAEEVAKMLLPNGKKDGKEWRVGSVDGEAGKSMGVCISGSNAGVWTDFATGEGGDLLDLWCASKGVGLADALSEAKAFLGVSEPNWSKPKKSYTKPHKPKCQRPAGEAMEWLTGTRKLSEDTVQAFQIAVDGEYVILPFKRGPEKDAEMPMCKRRSMKTKDTRPTSGGQMPCLFGWQAMPDNTREVTICEGEFDAMALRDYGIHALSVPFGGGKGEKQAWIENEFEALERFDTIYVCMDSDKVGREGALTIIERLGIDRCRLVNLPAKDANDCLIQGVPDEMVNKAFRNAVYLDPSELKQAEEYANEIDWALYPEDAPEIEGVIDIPWEHKRKDLFFRAGELIILVGVNGHGKSQMAGYLTLEAMRQGHRACVASMEIKPGRLLANMTKQATSQQQPTRGYIEAVISWYRDKVWIFECTKTAKAERILEVFEYAYKRYGIKWFVIDSFMKCGIDEDDYNRQKWFVERLADFKNEYNVTIALLAHPRKGESEMKPIEKLDIKGTGAIGDVADTVLTIWRNKPKEEMVERQAAGQDIGFDGDLDDLPDAVLKCVKQRNHPEGVEPKVNLWFDRKSLQYRAGPNAKPFQFVKYSGEREEL